MTDNNRQRAERGSKTNEEFAKRVKREWMRYWGKYDKPFEFNIAVTDLHEQEETKK